MIKFFRHIRKSLLMENKTGKYFKYAIGEIILVVIGILIALQINNWNEDKKQKINEIKTLESINATLKQDKIQLERIMPSNDNVRNSIDFILNHFNENLPYDNSLDYHFGNTTFTWVPNFQTSAFEALKSEGVNLISNTALRNSIIQFYDSGIKSTDWQTETYRNVIMDASKNIFNNRFNTNVTGYKNNSTDQIIPVNISHASGATSSLTNIGELEDIGLELDLTGSIIRSEDFNWDVGVNFFTNRTKVLSLTDGVDELDIGGFASAQVVARVGESYPLMRTTDYMRDDNGRVVVGDNGDPIRDPNNQIQGKTTPDYTLGFNTTLRYKGFTLYAVMDYRTGHVFYNSLVDALEFTGLTQHSASSGRQPFVFPNSVYSDGAGGYVANTNRLTTGGGNAFWDEYNLVKSNYITDATTLKLREVALTYNFDTKLFGDIGIDDLTIGAFGRNLLTFRPDSNVFTDPEFNFTTGNAVGVGTQSQTPPTRQYGLTLTVKF